MNIDIGEKYLQSRMTSVGRQLQRMTEQCESMRAQRDAMKAALTVERGMRTEQRERLRRQADIDLYRNGYRDGIERAKRAQERWLSAVRRDARYDWMAEGGEQCIAVLRELLELYEGDGEVTQ